MTESLPYSATLLLLVPSGEQPSIEIEFFFSLFQLKKGMNHPQANSEIRKKEKKYLKKVRVLLSLAP